MRRACQRALVHRQNKADPGVLPADIAETGDLGGDVAAQHVDRHCVSQLQPDLCGFLGGKADLGRAVIAFRPPLPGCHFGSGWLRIGIGDAAVAMHNPMPCGELFGALAVDFGDDATQHRSGLDPADGRIGIQPVLKARDLAGLNINKEIAGRYLWKFIRESIAQVAINLTDRRQYRQAKPER